MVRLTAIRIERRYTTTMVSVSDNNDDAGVNTENKEGRPAGVTLVKTVVIILTEMVRTLWQQW